MKRTWAVLAVALAALTFCWAVRAEQASVLLEKAVYTEETLGDVDGAIEIYKQVIDAPDATRALLQQAHHRLALSYMKKGMRTEAAEQLRRLTAYPGESELKADALKLLAELTTPDPAALMPPDTFLYVEFGSPGRQFETALNMLEDTPLANPITAVNQGMPAGAQPPNPMVGALLNPAMLEEFKKVGGLAVGVCGIMQLAGNAVQPDLVAVAYLGESDSLRGILQMAVTAAGRPMADLDGMHVVSFPGPQQTVLAYDDNVTIFTTSPDRLEWCIKQYRGTSDEPSLASGNATFAQVDVQKRHESALTLWVDARQAAKVLQGAASSVPELAKAVGVADMIVDQGVEAGRMRFVLDKYSPFAEISVDFAKDAAAPIYSMVRTAPLDRSLFRAVPPEAITVCASAFNPAQFPGLESTGADLSFMNDLAQYVAFALPLEPQAGRRDEAPGGPVAAEVLGRIGLVLSVRQDADAKVLVDSISALPQAIAATSGLSPLPPVRPEGDTVVVPLPPGGPVPELRLAAADGRIVIATRAEVLNASLKALGGGPSAMDSGPLHEPLTRLEVGTNQVILGNAGRLLSAGMEVARSTGNVDEQLSNLMGDLAEVLNQTSLQLYTHETDENMTVRMGVLDLPPAAEAMPVLMALSQYARTKGPGVSAGGEPLRVAVEEAPSPIVVDGDPGDWQDVPTTAWSEQRGDEPPLRLAWTADGLYGLVTSNDSHIEVNDAEPWTDDGLQVFIETDALRRSEHSEFSRSLLLLPTPQTGAGGANISVEFHGGGETPAGIGTDPVSGVEAVWKPNATGYTMEFFVPTGVLGHPVIQGGTQIGLCLMLRDGSAAPAAWLSSGVGDDAWARPDKWALVRFAGPPTPVDIGYHEGRIIVDGETSDWAGVPSLPTAEGYPFQLAWNEDGLYGLVTSKDDDIQPNPAQHWLGDGTQMFIERDYARSRDNTANCIDVALWPNPAAGPGPCGWSIFSHALNQNVQARFPAAWAPTADGYVMEFLLPAGLLRPARMLPGTVLGFTILLRTTGVEAAAIAPQDLGPDSYLHPDEWGAIRLVEQVK